MDKSILLIGGTNIDYLATSNNKLIKHSSNPGTLTISYGGVMRNVCENLARIGNKCYFLTAVGQDLYGKQIIDYMNNLSVEMISPTTNLPTSSYIAINDNNHDMDEGINDMRIMDEINARFLESYSPLIKNHEYVICDSNLSLEAIDYLFSSFKNQKFLVEGISASKIIKYKNHLKDIYMLKCNIYEARALFNNELDAISLVKMALDSGIKTAIITQGKDCIIYGEHNKVASIAVKRVDNISGNTTGCGDALFAGIIDHYIEGKSLKDSIIFGQKLSILTLETFKAVNETISSLSYNH
jgi:pseudouridine kinase